MSKYELETAKDYISKLLLPGDKVKRISGNAKGQILQIFEEQVLIRWEGATQSEWHYGPTFERIPND